MVTKQRRGGLRDAVRQMARARPGAPVTEIAARLGCHPDTARRYLRGTPRHAAEPLSLRRPAASSELAAGYVAEEARAAARYAEDPEAERWVLDVLRFSHNNSTSLLLSEVLLDRSDCPSEALAVVAASRETTSRRMSMVAAHPNCPRDVLRRLAASTDLGVRAAAAANPHTAGETLAEICDSSDAAVRAAAAGYRRVPARILKRLVADPDPAVRAVVAASRRCPTRVVNRAGRDRDAAVRAAAARNAAVSPRMLARLACDRDAGVRESAARNRNCPPRVLRILAGDSDSKVRAEVERRLRRARSRAVRTAAPPPAAAAGRVR